MWLSATRDDAAGPCARATLTLARAQGRMRDFQLRDFCALVDALAALTAGDAAAARAAMDAGLAPRLAGVLAVEPWEADGGPYRTAAAALAAQARRRAALPSVGVGGGGWCASGSARWCQDSAGLHTGVVHAWPLRAPRLRPRPAAHERGSCHSGDPIL